jgi:hypothetical protein
MKDMLRDGTNKKKRMKKESREREIVKLEGGKMKYLVTDRDTVQLMLFLGYLS